MNANTRGTEFNAIRRSMNSYELVISMGGFIGKETKKNAEADIRLMLRELSEQFTGSGIPKQVLITGALSVVSDMIDEYVPEEDGGLFDYLSAFACESMIATIEEDKNADPFEPNMKKEDDAFVLLPALQKKMLRMSKNADGQRIPSDYLAKDFEYLNARLVLKGIAVAERNYALNADLLSRAMRE